jgi:GNAT superfamily N-acetyltransferase
LPPPPGAAESTAPGARRWTPAAAVGRGAELLREEGARALAVRALGETVYRRLLIFERDLHEPPPSLDRAPAVVFDLLDEGGLAAYEALRPGRLAQATARLAAGDRCLAGWSDGRLVAVRWLATGSPHVEYLGLRLPLAPDEIYHYDTFTDPALRRRGVSIAAQRALFPRLRDEGYRWSVRAILPENRAAVADAARGGYERRGRMGYVRIGPFRREFLRWDRELRG